MGKRGKCRAHGYAHTSKRGAETISTKLRTNTTLSHMVREDSNPGQSLLLPRPRPKRLGECKPLCQPELDAPNGARRQQRERTDRTGARVGCRPTGKPCLPLGQAEGCSPERRQRRRRRRPRSGPSAAAPPTDALFPSPAASRSRPSSTRLRKSRSRASSAVRRQVGRGGARWGQRGGFTLIFSSGIRLAHATQVSAAQGLTEEKWGSGL